MKVMMVMTVMTQTHLTNHVLPPSRSAIGDKAFCSATSPRLTKVFHEGSPGSRLQPSDGWEDSASLIIGAT